MPQMSPSYWMLISIFELLIFYVLIFKMYFFSINMKIYFLKKSFKIYKIFNWKW
uniref:ATP synthase F0 subunit 8 n=1 Tax=Osmia rufa TaxID=1437190 RepID=A0A0S2LTM5_OSMRU|nr:ATP synthase F0 subunit 8 [Osmia bicornis]